MEFRVTGEGWNGGAKELSVPAPDPEPRATDPAGDQEFSVETCLGAPRGS